MKRRLVLMRHAKSAWNTAAAPDHARPLTARGRRDAARMAAFLVDAGWTPDAVVSSDSTRTRQTWQTMLPAVGPPLPPVEFHRDLYHGDIRVLRRLSMQWPDGWSTVLALGHNPGWEGALAQLSGDHGYLPTAACALLEGEGDTWWEALEGPWRLVQLARPKALPG